MSKISGLGMTDLSYALPADSTTAVKKAVNSTNPRAGQDLNMTDFLTLMVAMFQNQTIDDTADTSEMMNMMVQMSVVEAVSNISTLINDSSTLTYAASLVGKNVTIGEYTGNKYWDIKEIYGRVDGTAMQNGEQVVFVKGKTYKLSQIMAVGELPGSTHETDETNGAEAGGTSEWVDKEVSVIPPTAKDGDALSGNDKAWKLTSG